MLGMAVQFQYLLSSVPPACTVRPTLPHFLPTKVLAACLCSAAAEAAAALQITQSLVSLEFCNEFNYASIQRMTAMMTLLVPQPLIPRLL